MEDLVVERLLVPAHEVQHLQLVAGVVGGLDDAGVVDDAAPVGAVLLEQLLVELVADKTYFSFVRACDDCVRTLVQ